MGTDKAFLKISGMALIEHVIGALRTVEAHIIVVTNSPHAYRQWPVEVTTDALDKRGSLVGLYSGLLRSQDEKNIVVACDMPFLNPRLLSYLSGLDGSYDAVVPKIGEHIEPLHAVYRKSLLPVIKDHIERDQRRIQGIFAGRPVRFVTEDEIDRFDPLRRSFLNINTREEYEEATCSDLECRS
jgi:molybdopterin-guanine dinucleotide biosynthesis protein A